MVEYSPLVKLVIYLLNLVLSLKARYALRVEIFVEQIFAELIFAFFWHFPRN